MSNWLWKNGYHSSKNNLAPVKLRHREDQEMKKASTGKRASLNLENLNCNIKVLQRSRLLSALIVRGSDGLTTIDCREQLHIMHPAGRVKELREQGYK